VISRIWEHGQEYISQQIPDLRAWRCGHCNKNWFTILKNTKTSDALQYLVVIHGLELGSQKVVPTKRKVPATVEVEEEEAQPKQPRIRQLIQTLDVLEWRRRRLMRWIVRNHIPFTAVEDEEFRGMLTALNQAVEPCLITGDSVKNWLSDAFKRVGLQVMHDIASKEQI
jgi:hypothetical protein